MKRVVMMGMAKRNKIPGRVRTATGSEYDVVDLEVPARPAARNPASPAVTLQGPSFGGKVAGVQERPLIHRFPGHHRGRRPVRQPVVPQSDRPACTLPAGTDPGTGPDHHAVVAAGGGQRFPVAKQLLGLVGFPTGGQDRQIEKRFQPRHPDGVLGRVQGRPLGQIEPPLLQTALDV